MASLARGIDPLPQGLAERAAADQLEDQEVVLPTLEKPMDATDVGVVELGEDASLGEEAGAGSGIHAVAADGLEGDRALELFVEAHEDRPHPPFGQGAVDADVPDAVAWTDHGASLSWRLPLTLPGRERAPSSTESGDSPQVYQAAPWDELTQDRPWPCR
jgi:hypothetical protein